jgi:hypothetical protein
MFKLVVLKHCAASKRKAKSGLHFFGQFFEVILFANKIASKTVWIA